MEKYEFIEMGEQEVKKYRKLFLELPPSTSTESRIVDALGYNIPIEYLVYQGIIDSKNISKLDIDSEIKNKIVAYLVHTGKMVEGDIRETVEEEPSNSLETHKVYIEEVVEKNPIETIKELEYKINILEKENSKIKNDLHEEKSKILKNKNESSVKDERIKILEIQIKGLENELNNINNKYSNYNHEINKMNYEINDLKDIVKEKIEIIQSKETEIANSKLNLSKLEDRLIDKDTECIQKIESLKIRQEEKLEEYRKMLQVVPRETTDVDSISEIKSSKDVRRAQLEGKKIVGVIGKGKNTITRYIEENEKYFIASEPENADLWIVVTNPSKDSVEEFKNNINGKENIIKIMNLWDKSLPFEPSSMLGTDIDIRIELDSNWFKNTWLGKEGNNNTWVTQLNRLIKDKLQ